MPKAITHEAQLHCTSGIMAAFLRQIDFLGNKLGPILIQIPPSLKFDCIRARTFLSVLRDQFCGRVVWEPRHSSWFTEQVDQLFKEFRIARVAADPACVPAAALPGGVANLVYMRLHGSPRRYYSAYSTDFLNELALRLADLSNTARIWCVFDNTASGSAFENALGLTARLKAIVASSQIGV